jgi:hypothetical protein
VCDLETSRIGAPYIYDISNLRVKLLTFLKKMLFFLICSITPLTRKLVIRIASYVPSGKFVEASRDKLALKLPVIG